MNKKPESIISDLVDKLTALRKQRGISHNQLAEKIGISRTAISLIESKKRTPTILTCIRIAQALGSRLSDILDD